MESTSKGKRYTAGGGDSGGPLQTAVTPKRALGTSSALEMQVGPVPAPTTRRGGHPPRLAAPSAGSFWSTSGPRGGWRLRKSDKVLKFANSPGSHSWPPALEMSADSMERVGKCRRHAICIPTTDPATALRSLLCVISLLVAPLRKIQLSHFRG